MDLFSITKAIHIIFVVSYFAGIVYMVRVFIYHIEALQKDEPERSILHRQFSFMEERLWNIITVPALIIMSVTGTYMFYLMNWAYFLFGWMHVKLLFIGILLWYHYYSWRIMKRLQAGQATLTSLQLRMLNEVASHSYPLRGSLCSSAQSLIYYLLVFCSIGFCSYGGAYYADSEVSK